MELPKLNYDDFYKFLVSLGVILVVITIIGIFILIKDFLFYKWIFILFMSVFVSVLIFGLVIIIWANIKWYKNQKITDKILKGKGSLIEKDNELKELEIEAKKRDLKIIEFRDKEQAIQPRGHDLEKELEIITKSETKSSTALVSYKIASVLPNSVSFNFLRDWKVWFLIVNHDSRKYKAYVKIKFIADSFEEEVPEGYYGGVQAWKLDAFSGIQAPGLGISEAVKNVAEEGKRVKIQINCEVRDENDILIEKKFPQTYIYDDKNNSWFLEP